MSKKGSKKPASRQAERYSDLPTHCSVLAVAEETARLGEELSRSLRRLRRALIACRRCDQAPACPLMERFRAQVDAALAEVLDQWDAW